MTHCCWGLCNSDSQYGPASKRPRDDMVGVKFIPFPQPQKQLEKCLKWIKLCGNAKITKPSDITRNHYVCSKHFIGGAGPTEEHPDPVSAVGGEIETAHSIAKHRKRPPPKERCAVPLAKTLKTDDIRAACDPCTSMSTSSQETDNLHSTTTAGVQTEISIDLESLMTGRPKNVSSMKRQFLNDDIMKNDQSCKFYTGLFN